LLGPGFEAGSLAVEPAVPGWTGPASLPIGAMPALSANPHFNKAAARWS
jgi:hypothetical protein